VDDYIQAKRKRVDGEVEEFSNPREALMLLHKIDAKERRSRVISRLEWAREIPIIRSMRRIITTKRRTL
jgi:hypothetical protein